MTPEQKEASPKFTKEDYAKDEVFQRLQWEIRNAFENGYRAGNKSGEMSILDPKKGKWFDHWVYSRNRDFLIANRLMTGEEGYK